MAISDLKGLFITLICIQLGVQGQILTSNLLCGQKACPGQQVTFICETNGSLVLGWSSLEYVGPRGVQLELVADHGEGFTVSSNTYPSTSATIISISGNRITESALNITVSQRFETASITCIDVGHLNSSVAFHVIDIPSAPRNVTITKEIALLGENCVIVLQWSPPINMDETTIKHYIVDFPSGTCIAQNTTVRIALLVDHCNSSNIETFIRIHAVDVCNRDGQSTNDSLAELLSGVVRVTTRTELQATTTDSALSDVCNQIVIGGVLGTLLFIETAIIVGLCIGLVVVVVWQRKPKDGHSEKQDDTEYPNSVESALLSTTEPDLPTSDTPKSPRGKSANAMPEIEQSALLSTTEPDLPTSDTPRSPGGKSDSSMPEIEQNGFGDEHSSQQSVVKRRVKRDNRESAKGDKRAVSWRKSKYEEDDTTSALLSTTEPADPPTSDTPRSPRGKSANVMPEIEQSSDEST